jgi:AraC-like DNA-binding protein
VIETLILSARDAGIPVQRYLKLSGLPDLPWGEQDPHLPVPLAAGMDFLEIVARKEGTPLFGIQAATSLPIEAIRSLHLGLAGCANLKQVLERFMEQARLQSTVADYRLEYQEDAVWLRHRGGFPRSDALQSELYTLAGMVEVVRLVAGPQWTPVEVEFTAKASQHVRKSEFFGAEKVFFQQSSRGIVLPRSMLAMQNPMPPAWLEQDWMMRPLPGKGLASQLQAIVPAYLSNSLFGEELIARLAGMSFRSMQRQLAKEGESYSGIVTCIRQQMAEQLLAVSSERLTDIARQLGYSNLPNFSRAFRRWTGVTPGEYRRLRLQGCKVSIVREHTKCPLTTRGIDSSRVVCLSPSSIGSLRQNFHLT